MYIGFIHFYTTTSLIWTMITTTRLPLEILFISKVRNRNMMVTFRPGERPEPPGWFRFHVFQKTIVPDEHAISC